MFIPKHNLFYQQKYISPYVNAALQVVSFMAHLAAAFLIVSATLEFGFELTDRLKSELNWLYFGVWITFLVDRISHLILKKGDYWKSKYSFWGWGINGLLALTLLPIIVKSLGIDDSAGLMSVLDNQTFHLLVLFVISVIDLSNAVISSLGRKLNPALMMAVSFLFIILVGSGLLLMPRCIQHGVHLSWIDSLFTATSAVCVTGLTTTDVPTTFTVFGQSIIMLLIQIGGLGVMTITSFFALFFMGNSSIYNQMLVRDMVSSKSLASLWSTLLNIFGFTAFIELAGAVAIFLNVHGTIGLSLGQELFFSIFHSISAFCNGGFSIYRGGLSAPVLMENHCWLYIIVSLLIILGGIGYPVLVNFKTFAYKHIIGVWRWMHGQRYVRFSIPNLFDMNTKIVLYTTTVLILVGSAFIGYYEWNNTFSGMRLEEKLTQAFFNAVSPRTAGFISIDLGDMCIQSIIIYTLLMWIGGASQSTAGGIKVNAFAVSLLNMRAVLRGADRVEFAGRELSLDSLRRANVAIFASIGILTVFVFVMTVLEPHLPLKAIVFECVSAFSTVGSSLGITAQLGETAKLLLVVLMFMGRVGLVTLAQGVLRQYQNQNYQLPKDSIIIS